MEMGIIWILLLIADFEDYDYLIKSGDTMFEPVDGAIEYTFHS